MRPLYLLALLQLVAGPLILLPCVFVGKVVTSCSQEKTAWAKIVRGCDSDIWQQAAKSSLKLTLDTTQQEPVSPPTKPKQAKDCLIAIEWNRGSSLFQKDSPLNEIDTEPVLLRKDRTQTPAIPPPRYSTFSII